ncbi:MAG: hypothetical protein P4L85_04110 [Paludisphaera borealis]|uniref:hypothetical protein n=1 Tax=Paludisphaera borealis TaxID=1387353 RepID=UPI0028404BA1|nr:hypothetical protein [Paludisphaera borealis]MDR3618512.1 hypothetical protein [Paludisphaera borealis]
MSSDVQLVLDSFDRLATQEKREALAELLLRTREIEWPPLDDEAVDRIAAESFLEYDRDEANDGQG